MTPNHGSMNFGSFNVSGVNVSGVKVLGPQDDQRWDRFATSQAMATIYHTSAWKELIRRCYGHEPVYLYVQDGGGDVRAGLPLFAIKGGLTPARLSTLPCAQHCNPLVSQQEELERLLQTAVKILDETRARCYELRTSADFPLGNRSIGATSNCYCTHVLDLSPDLDQIRRSFHKSCVQRAIKKAAAADLTLRAARGSEDIARFYRLYFEMRRQRGLLAQPERFFEIMRQVMAPQKRLEILHAYRGEQVVSSILLLKYKDTVTYEYGASRPDALHTRASHFLLWNAIQRAKAAGYREFDFGRTSVDNRGLVEFKSRWGTRYRGLAYHDVSKPQTDRRLRESRVAKTLMRCAVRYAPRTVCRWAGDRMYRYLV